MGSVSSGDAARQFFLYVLSFSQPVARMPLPSKSSAKGDSPWLCLIEQIKLSSSGIRWRW